MKHPLLLLAMTVWTSGCDTVEVGELLCPEQWHGDGYECVPDDDWLAAQPKPGAYGFAKTIEGGCGPGDNACEIEFVGGLEILLYLAPDDATVDAACIDWDAAPDMMLAPRARVVTDEEGRFSVALDPGNYCLRVTDPVDARWETHPVQVDAGAATPVALDFNHGNY